MGERPKIQCKAQSKQSGTRCRRWAAPGQLVCTSHGAKAPQAMAKASERITAQQAARSYAEFTAGNPAEAVDDPFTLLSKLAGEADRWRVFCQERMAQLEELRYEGFGAEQIRGEAQLFNDALDRCIKVCVAIAKLDIDKRLAAVNEKVGAAIEQVLTIAFEEIELTDSQREAVLPAIRRGLAAVS